MLVVSKSYPFPPFVSVMKSAVLFHKHNYLVGIKNNKKEHGW